MSLRARRCAGVAAAAALSIALTATLLRSVGVGAIVDTYRRLRPSAALFPLLWLGASLARAAIYHRLIDGKVAVFELVPLMWVRGLVVDLVPARAGLVAIPVAMRLVWGLGLVEGFGAIVGVTVVEVAS